ncbi:MAG: hypothetical protein ACYCPQ_02710 [Elusimicrobiota bacterium]
MKMKTLLMIGAVLALTRVHAGAAFMDDAVNDDLSGSRIAAASTMGGFCGLENLSLFSAASFDRVSAEAEKIVQAVGKIAKESAQTQAQTAGGANAPIHPGKERWAVKTLSDPDASAVDLSNIVDTSIGWLGSNPPNSPWDPAKYPSNSRTLSGPYSETQVYRVHALLTAARFEGDGDFHLMLQDPSDGSTGIAEIPDPDFVASQDPRVIALLAAARQKFISLFGVPPRYPGTYTPQSPVPVIVTGVRFFDVLHGQDNAAPNGVELHPVTGLDLDQSANGQAAKRD